MAPVAAARLHPYAHHQRPADTRTGAPAAQPRVRPSHRDRRSAQADVGPTPGRTAPRGLRRQRTGRRADGGVHGQQSEALVVLARLERLVLAGQRVDDPLLVARRRLVVAVVQFMRLALDPIVGIEDHEDPPELARVAIDRPLGRPRRADHAALARNQGPHRHGVDLDLDILGLARPVVDRQRHELRVEITGGGTEAVVVDPDLELHLLAGHRRDVQRRPGDERPARIGRMHGEELAQPLMPERVAPSGRIEHARAARVPRHVDPEGQVERGVGPAVGRLGPPFRPAQVLGEVDGVLDLLDPGGGVVVRRRHVVRLALRHAAALLGDAPLDGEALGGRRRVLGGGDLPPARVAGDLEVDVVLETSPGEDGAADLREHGVLDPQVPAHRVLGLAILPATGRRADVEVHR